MKIYTKTGDKGETCLFTGQRVFKNDPLVIAMGTVDECNSALGAAIAFLSHDPESNTIREQLESVQHALFDVGAVLATRAVKTKLNKTRFDDEATESLEKWIDVMETKLPTLHTFILPGGDPCGAMLHLARSICRRAEREIVPLNRNGDVSDAVLIYLNRLSDYLFMVSRYVNFINKSPEIQWQPHKHNS